MTGRSCVRPCRLIRSLTNPLRPLLRLPLAAVVLLAGSACFSAPEPAGPPATPVYNQTTGRLEQVLSDTDGDGKVDTRAFMDGRRLQRIEADRDADGRPDRWEYYVDAPPERVRPDAPDGYTEIERVEEANGPDARITRREVYEQGQLARVEDDSDLDGHVDRWEYYDHGVLSRLEMDLKKAGFPNQRMLFRKDGDIQRVEVDPTGSGVWHEAPAPPPVK